MTTAYQDFNEVMKRGANKRLHLSNELEEARNRLSELEQDYNNHVLSGNDKEADNLFNQIYELRKTIENNVKKLQIIQANKAIKTSEVEGAAQKVVRSSLEAIKQLEDKKLQKEKQLEKIMEDYFNKVEEIGNVCEKIQGEHLTISKVIDYLPDDAKPVGYHAKLGYHPASKSAHDYFNIHDFKINHDPLIYRAFKGQRKKGEIR